MLKCEACGKQTGIKESTGKKFIYKKWTDKQGRERKDIVSETKVCQDCI